jgi:Na+-driven multidrug efflux pump
MTNYNGPLEAFATAAGISAYQLSLLLRTTLLAGFFIWAAWCVLQILKYYKQHPNESIATLIQEYTRIFFLISVMIALVFIA